MFCTNRKAKKNISFAVLNRKHLFASQRNRLLIFFLLRMLRDTENNNDDTSVCLMLFFCDILVENKIGFLASTQLTASQDINCLKTL